MNDRLDISEIFLNGPYNPLKKHLTVTNFTVIMTKDPGNKIQVGFFIKKKKKKKKKKKNSERSASRKYLQVCTANLMTSFAITSKVQVLSYCRKFITIKIVIS